MALEPDARAIEWAAEMLGCEQPRSPRPAPREELGDERRRRQERRKDAATTVPRVPLRCPVLLHATLRKAEEDSPPEPSPQPERPAWTTADDRQVERMFERPTAAALTMPPLFSRRQLLSRCLPHLRVSGIPLLDVPRLVERLSRAQLGWPLPMRRSVAEAARVVIYADWSAHQRCFGDDYRAAAEALLTVFGRGRCELWWLKAGPSASARQAGWVGMRSRPVDAQTALVVLSDFGQCQGGDELAWQQALSKWSGRVGALLCLSPCRASAPGSGASVRGLSLAVTKSRAIEAESADALETLLAALAPAITVEPALIRGMRRALLPGTDPGLEQRVWQHEDLVGQLPYRRWLPARQSEWLDRLATMPESQLGLVRDVLQTHHSHLCLAQRDEEEALVGSLVFASAADDVSAGGAPTDWHTEYLEASKRTEALARHFARLASADDGSVGPPGRAGVAARATERLTRMPLMTRKAGLLGAEDLARASIQARSGAMDAVIVLPEGTPFDPRVIDLPRDELASGHPLTVEIRQLGSGLWLGLKSTLNRSASVGVSLLYFKMKPGLLWIQVGAVHRLIPVSQSMRSVEIHPDPAGAMITVTGGGGDWQFEVLPLKRPRGVKAWNQADGVLAIVDGLGSGSDVRFTQSDLAVGVDEQDSRNGGRVGGAVLIKRGGSPSLIWGFDDEGAFCRAGFRAEAGLVTQTFRYIEPGTFLMGSPEGVGRKDEHPQHQVTISQGYWLADTPCTQALWQAVMGQNPSDFKDGPDAPERPVDSVGWDNVQTFLKRLNAQLPPNTEAFLPTEAQWEYAARAGTRTAYWWGDDADSGRAIWNLEQKGTTPVKRFAPNPWGLYDVHGNVWEWCAGSGRTYRDQAELDPPDGDDKSARALRGGSWDRRPGRARAAFRSGSRRGYGWHSIGFRLALRSVSPGGGAAADGSRSEPAASGRGAPDEPARRAVSQKTQKQVPPSPGKKARPKTSR